VAAAAARLLRLARAATFYSIFYCSIIKKRDFAAYLITLAGAKAAAAATLFSSFAPSEQEKLNFAAAAQRAFLFLGRRIRA
jgi:hypothetical protein